MSKKVDRKFWENLNELIKIARILRKFWKFVKNEIDEKSEIERLQGNWKLIPIRKENSNKKGRKAFN